MAKRHWKPDPKWNLKPHIKSPGRGVLLMNRQTLNRNDRSPDLIGCITLDRNVYEGQTIYIMGWKNDINDRGGYNIGIMIARPPNEYGKPFYREVKPKKEPGEID